MSEEEKDNNAAPGVGDDAETQPKTKTAENKEEGGDGSSEKASESPMPNEKRMLEERLVSLSCKARQGCDGTSALMTKDPRNNHWVRYTCESCNGTWTISKGGQFSM